MFLSFVNEKFFEFDFDLFITFRDMIFVNVKNLWYMIRNLIVQTFFDVYMCVYVNRDRKIYIIMFGFDF